MGPFERWFTVDPRGSVYLAHVYAYIAKSHAPIRQQGEISF